MLTLVAVIYLLEYHRRLSFFSLELEMRRKQKQQELVDRLPEAVVVVNSRTKAIVSTNNALRRLLNLQAPELSSASRLADFAATNRGLDDSIKGVLLDHPVIDRMGSIVHEGRVMSLKEIVLGGQSLPRPSHFELAQNDSPTKYLEVSRFSLDFEGNACDCYVLNDQTTFRELEQAKLSKYYQRVLIASVSHELRTPIHVEIGMWDLLIAEYADLLRPQSSKPIPLSQSLEQVNRLALLGKANMKMLLYFADGIHDLSLLEAEEFTPEITSFNLHKVLRECCELLESSFLEKRIRLIYEVDPSTPLEVSTDEKRYSTILMTLLGNALHYTVEGHVKVAITHDSTSGQSQIVTTVADTGVGMTRTQIEQALKLYGKVTPELLRRGSMGRRANPQGAGIGLTISRRLAFALDGTLKVNSIHGQGTSFRFTIATKYQKINESLLRRHTSRTSELAGGLHFPFHRFDFILVANRHNEETTTTICIDFYIELRCAEGATSRLSVEDVTSFLDESIPIEAREEASGSLSKDRAPIQFFAVRDIVIPRRLSPLKDAPNPNPSPSPSPRHSPSLSRNPQPIVILCSPP